MASEWQVVRLGDAITLKRGYDLPNQARMAGNVPIVSSSGVSGFHSEAKVRAPGVVTGRYGTIGQVHFIENDFWPLNTTLYVQDFKGNLPRFVRYLLQTIDYHQFSDKAAVPGVNRNDLHEAKISLPPLVEQHAIAETLGALDDRIDNLRQTNTTLESIAAALFKSWFVDFDGVPPEDMQESELGLLPKGWRTGTLADLCDLKYGKALKATERREGEIPVYGSGGITGYHDEALVTKPTIIVGRKGTVGALYWQSGPCFPIDTVFYVEPKVSLHFCYYAMMQMRLHNLNTDAAVPGLNRDNAYRQSVVIPSTENLAKWDALASNLRARMDNAAQQAGTLTALRDILLPRLISGKLRVAQ
ncbi:restriction endonuclease subunit S [Xanthomonas axonopodis]|uniref:restriction endonuclease subunit S n=1 Tax=Xanthomonas axonopodis TaxID=53413 RepID=UPI003556AF94